MIVIIHGCYSALFIFCRYPYVNSCIYSRCLCFFLGDVSMDAVDFWDTSACFLGIIVCFFGYLSLDGLFLVVS